MDPNDYEFAALDLGVASERRTGFAEAIHRSFLEPRPTDELVQMYADHAVRDGARATGVWLPDGRFGSGPSPVATFLSFDGTLHTGRDLLPTWMITDVTVSPAHRRRGLLRRLMESELRAAATAGAPFAALTASEASIYGRFGFGPASFLERVRVDTGPTFALRKPISEIRVELVKADALGDIPEANFASVHVSTRGSLSRPSFYAPWLRGELDPETGEVDRKVQCAVALDADDTPVGHVSWKPVGDKDGRSTAEVVDLVARTPRAHLALWQFLAGIDLIDAVQVRMTDTDPLRWALTDHRCVRTVKREDLLWLRVLDVPTALAARPWNGDGQVVLEIADALGHAAGTWTVTVDAGVATLEPGGSPSLGLDVETLSSLYLGAVQAPTLAAAGRIRGTADAVTELARLLGDGMPSANRTFF